MRVVGLPLHLWSREVFKRIGDGCGGFVIVNEDIDSLSAAVGSDPGEVCRKGFTQLCSCCCGVGVLFLSFVVGDST